MWHNFIRGIFHLNLLQGVSPSELQGVGLQWCKRAQGVNRLSEKVENLAIYSRIISQYVNECHVMLDNILKGFASSKFGSSVLMYHKGRLFLSGTFWF